MFRYYQNCYRPSRLSLSGKAERVPISRGYELVAGNIIKRFYSGRPHGARQAPERLRFRVALSKAAFLLPQEGGAPCLKQ